MASGLPLNPLILIGGSLSLVVGLSWNDFINESIKYYYPVKDRESLRARFTYAVIVTLVIVLIAYILYYLNQAAIAVVATSADVINKAPTSALLKKPTTAIII
jgi:uncharacterized BrkB/YihY/UPF0761 family membrane protein